MSNCRKSNCKHRPSEGSAAHVGLGFSFVLFLTDRYKRSFGQGGLESFHSRVCLRPSVNRRHPFAWQEEAQCP